MSRRTSLLVFKQLLQPQVRHFNTKRITNSISFSSKEPLDIQGSNQNPATLFPHHEGRKLAIILPWMQANEKVVEKYAQFYTSQDFDVITFRISVAQFLFPASIDKTIKRQLLPLLFSCDHPHKIIHGLSVGCYNYGRISKLIEEEEDKKDNFLNTIKAQVWDSIGNMKQASRGIAVAISPQSPYLQEKIVRAINFYLKKNPYSNYYFEVQEYVDHHPIKAPALFLASVADNVASPEAARNYQKLWQTEHGIPCSEYVWKDTKHVAHMRKYPHEYWEKVGNFLKNQGVDMDLHQFWQTQASTDNRKEEIF